LDDLTPWDVGVGADRSGRQIDGDRDGCRKPGNFPEARSEYAISVYRGGDGADPHAGEDERLGGTGEQDQAEQGEQAFHHRNRPQT
jgi:hypothetical protein